MEENVRVSKEMQELADQVIEETSSLHWIRDIGIRIGYLVSDREKKSKGGLCYGECHRVSAREKAYNPNDFTITIYEVNAAQFSAEQMRILMLHELMHIGIDGSGKPRIVPHDVEDFAAIIDNYGHDWSHA